jgi:hypothetical protein
VFHSVIIGVTMGMSQDVCAIRPLVVALSFHQVFEGMGLGGCIAQVNLIDPNLNCRIAKFMNHDRFVYVGIIFAWFTGRLLL